MTIQVGRLKYAKTHEWVREENAGTAIVGISAHAQSLLGDVVFVELPAPGTCVKRQESIAVIESVKAASDVYAPVSGVILKVNDDVVNSPELINESPLERGWLFSMQLDDATELDELMDGEVYQDEHDSAFS
ncbi:MAG: glycine cleavage system protein GcvH [Pseudohongiella sp.]|uniref:glycine cleavage system protein GcvH n=1 Tax=Pseudohongiella sp. TaxID=1979412 RepID=UPI0034A0648F